jgi:hypothetical protein
MKKILIILTFIILSQSVFGQSWGMNAGNVANSIGKDLKRVNGNLWQAGKLGDQEMMTYNISGNYGLYAFSIWAKMPSQEYGREEFNKLINHYTNLWGKPRFLDEGAFSLDRAHIFSSEYGYEINDTLSALVISLYLYEENCYLVIMFQHRDAIKNGLDNYVRAGLQQ